MYLCELCACVYINQCTRQHANLANEIKCQQTDWCQSHHHIDDEEWKNRYQPKSKEIEGAVLSYTFINDFQSFLVTFLDKIMQQRA